MLLQYLLVNVHFALTVFAALAFFATGWLYVDSWSLKKENKTPLLRAIGFFLLAFSFALHATAVGLSLVLLSVQLTKIVGLICIFISLLKEPMLHKPSESRAAVFITTGSTFFYALSPISAVLYLVVGLAYLRKSTEGLEIQLRPAGIAFILLGVSECLSVTLFGQNTPIVFWSRLLADYGLLFNLSHALQAAGVVILAVWSFGYLRFRLQAQLFITTIALSLIVFLVTTFLFTFLLLKSLENDALSHLNTDVNVLRFALERVQKEALSHAKAIARDGSFQEELDRNNPEDLYKLTSSLMLSQQTSFLSVASTSGEVIMRAEDKEKIGDNIGEELIVKSALAGKPLSTITISEYPTPQIIIQAAAAISKQNTGSAKNSGVIVTGFIIDSAFVDNIKDVTGLDTTVFANNKRAATTFVGSDGTSRFIATEETNKKILTQVLSKGETYLGDALVLNQPYYVAYAPLKTQGDKIIGMLFMGKLQNTLFQTAQQSLGYTFLGSVVLMLLSVPLSYLIARNTYKNITA